MSNIKEPFGVGPGTTTNVGTAGTNVTAAEYGNGTFHKTVLTLSSVTLLSTTAAAKAGGALIYTLPAGAVVTKSEYVSIALTATLGVNTTDTPVIGLGTTIGTGAVAVLSGTAGFVNMMAGQAVADCNGTAKVKTVSTSLVVEAADPHIIHLNAANTWTGIDTMKASGTVTIEWTYLPA
jgi:hypothetical protein